MVFVNVNELPARNNKAFLENEEEKDRLNAGGDLIPSSIGLDFL